MPFFFDHYPYTNFHNVNLDWVLQAVKAWGAMVEQNNQNFIDLDQTMRDFRSALETDWTNYQNTINNEYSEWSQNIYSQWVTFWNEVRNYLRDLDVSQEISDKLDEMLATGDLAEIINPTIASTVTQWLTDNITPTTPVIDKTLTVNGAGADSRVVGTRLHNIDNDLLSLFNNIPIGYDIIQNNTPSVTSVNLTWDGFSNFSMNGVPSQSTLFANILGATSTIPSSITKGRTYYFELECDNATIYPDIYVKHSDDSGESLHDINNTTNKKVISYTVKPDDKGVLFRIGIPKNGSNPVIANGTVNIHSDYYTPYISNTTTSIENEILRRLNKFGLCIFEEGEYTINSSITMPDNSKIDGFGNASIITYNGSGTCFVMGSQSHIENILIQGANIDITIPTYENIENKHAIEWSGNTKQYGVVSNCIIQRFSGSAIYALDTMTPTDHNLTVTDCQIRNCCIGVYIKRDSEFIKITGCTITKNTIGILNRGGNNIIANCGVDANITNIIINADEGSNNGHGAITNCSVNHADNNNGYGLIINGTGRMLISNCNFYFSKIKLSDGNGNIINGCGFGNDAIIEIDEGANNRCDIITNCMMRSTANVINVTSGIPKISNCWTREGVAVEATQVTP